MALLTFLSDPSSSSGPKPAAATKKHTSNHKERNKHTRQPPKHHQQRQGQPPPAPASSWDQFKNLLSCKHLEPAAKVHDPSRAGDSKVYSMLGSSCRSICYFKDAIHGNTRVVHRLDNSPEGSTVGQDVGLLKKKGGHGGSSSGRSSSSLTVARSATHSGGSKGMPFRKLSGCYECRMIVDPIRYPYTPRSTICACSQCGEAFPKIEILELHQAVRHAGQEEGGSSQPKDVRTTVSSGRAHDLLRCPAGRRAMLVCRVIAGKIRRAADDAPIADDDVMSSPAIGAMSSYYDSGRMRWDRGDDGLPRSRNQEMRESKTGHFRDYCGSGKYCQCHVVYAKLKDSPAASAAYAALSTASTYVLCSNCCKISNNTMNQIGISGGSLSNSFEQNHKL